MKHPHIIILNPDEMRWDSMGHMGNPAAQTPYLDYLVREEAVSFGRAYCQNPVCVPSRCSFFTGLYPHTRGHRTMQYLLHEEEPTLFSELKEAGYYVWMNGRNDLLAGQIPGLEEHHADQVFYYDDSEKQNGAGGRKPQKAEEDPFPYSHFEGKMESGEDKDWRDTKAACDFLKNRPEPEKPLCLFLGWVNPHPPYQVEEPYFSAIDRSQVPLRVRYEDTKGKSLMIQRLHELVGMDGYTEEQWTEMRAVYLAQCSKVDAMIRKVSETLKETGMYDDSAIFILSDHGDFCGDYGLPEKAQNTFEDCLTRVPLLIKPPKGMEVDAGVSMSLAELVDFYATVMDLAGVKAGHDHFGSSLRPVLADRSATVREYVCCEGGRLPGEDQCDEWHASNKGKGPAKKDPYWPKKTAQLDAQAHEKGTMIFDGRYKYVRRMSGNDELYDLELDPREEMNLFGRAEAGEPVMRLRERMLDWYQKTCDTVPRTYDSRVTEEGIWAVVRNMCPPDQEKAVRAYIRKESPGIVDAVMYTLGLVRKNQSMKI